MNALIRGRDTGVGTDRAGRTPQVQTGEDGITGSWFKIVWLRNLSIYQEPSHITAPTRRSHPNRPSLTQEPLPRSRPPPGRVTPKEPHPKQFLLATLKLVISYHQILYATRCDLLLNKS